MDMTLAKEEGGLILGLLFPVSELIYCREKGTSFLVWLPCWPSGIQI